MFENWSWVGTCRVQKLTPNSEFFGLVSQFFNGSIFPFSKNCVQNNKVPKRLLFSVEGQPPDDPLWAPTKSTLWRHLGGGVEPKAQKALAAQAELLAFFRVCVWFKCDTCADTPR